MDGRSARPWIGVVMKSFKFHKLEHEYTSDRTLMLDLLSDDALTGITFSSSAFLVLYECKVWSKNEVLWEKKIDLNLPDQGTLGARGRDDIEGMKRLIAACLPELVMSGYMPVGPWNYGVDTFPLNPHEPPLEVVHLPPDFQN